MRGGVERGSTPPGRVRSVVFLMLCAVVAASCSSPGRNPVDAVAPSRAPLTAMLTAMQAAGAGRLTGALVDERTTAIATLAGAWHGDSSGVGDVSIASVAAAHSDAELRWRGRALFLRRSVGRFSQPALTALVRTATERPWRRFELVGDGAGDTLMASFDPLSLVALLQRLQVPVSNVGTTRTATDRISEWKALRRVMVGFWPHATVRLRYDVHALGSELRVTLPPPGAVANGTVAADHAVGAYVVARAGSTTGVAWELERANGTSGTTCWRWRARPALTQPGNVDVQCAPPPDPRAPPTDQVEFLVDGNGAGSYDALALTLPAGTRAVELGFVGGRKQTEPVANPFVWVGPTTPAVAFVHLTLSDGAVVECGAGAVSGFDDLRNPTLTAASATAPWNCLP
jgi:hypothetical protein